MDGVAYSEDPGEVGLFELVLNVGGLAVGLELCREQVAELGTGLQEEAAGVAPLQQYGEVDVVEVCFGGSFDDLVAVALCFYFHLCAFCGEEEFGLEAEVSAGEFCVDGYSGLYAGVEADHGAGAGGVLALNAGEVEAAFDAEGDLCVGEGGECDADRE